MRFSSGCHAKGSAYAMHYHAGQQASQGKFLCAGEQRAYRVKVRAQDLTGQPLTLTLTDWRARIFQHEFDHLQVPHASRSFTDCGLLEQLMYGLPVKRCMRMVQLKNCSVLCSYEPAACVWNAALASLVSCVDASRSVIVQLCKAVKNTASARLQAGQWRFVRGARWPSWGRRGGRACCSTTAWRQPP